MNERILGNLHTANVKARVLEWIEKPPVPGVRDNLKLEAASPFLLHGLITQLATATAQREDQKPKEAPSLDKDMIFPMFEPRTPLEELENLKAGFTQIQGSIKARSEPTISNGTELGQLVTGNSVSKNGQTLTGSDGGLWDEVTVITSPSPKLKPGSRAFISKPLLGETTVPSATEEAKIKVLVAQRSVLPTSQADIVDYPTAFEHTTGSTGGDEIRANASAKMWGAEADTTKPYGLYQKILADAVIGALNPANDTEPSPMSSYMGQRVFVDYQHNKETNKFDRRERKEWYAVQRAGEGFILVHGTSNEILPVGNLLPNEIFNQPTVSGMAILTINQLHDYIGNHDLTNDIAKKAPKFPFELKRTDRATFKIPKGTKTTPEVTILQELSKDDRFSLHTARNKFITSLPAAESDHVTYKRTGNNYTATSVNVAGQTSEYTGIRNEITNAWEWKLTQPATGEVSENAMALVGDLQIGDYHFTLQNPAETAQALYSRLLANPSIKIPVPGATHGGNSDMRVLSFTEVPFNQNAGVNITTEDLKGKAYAIGIDFELRATHTRALYAIRFDESINIFLDKQFMEEMISLTEPRGNKTKEDLIAGGVAGHVSNALYIFLRSQTLPNEPTDASAFPTSLTNELQKPNFDPNDPENKSNLSKEAQEVRNFTRSLIVYKAKTGQ